MTQAQARPVPIWGWIAAFFAGLFLINTVPHGVMGLTGQAFPTALSGGPPNLSSAMVNVVYAAANAAIGFWLLHLLRPWRGRTAVRAVIVLAAVAFGVVLAWTFSTMM